MLSLLTSSTAYVGRIATEHISKCRHFAKTCAVVIALLLTLANVAVDIAVVSSGRQAAALRSPPLSKYSFLDEDYPPRLPLMNSREAVQLSLEESVRYDPQHPESNLEWRYVGAASDGNIRLGPNHRFFNTGFSYELHCLRFVIGMMLHKDDPPTERADRAHVSRCLNVLRQFALCSADTALEPADTLDPERNYTTQRVAGERQCADWPALYETMKQNWIEWVEVREGSDT
ncbi:hypothetical protein GY45DRAFT_202644 [Cubamyces sp. BRFM 1775]|nr:hypothetical protein GY45DRAFT_202644 [Cubamyces sp. BRFM 1775]